MGKSRVFLRIFASLFITFFATNVFAAGYTCPTYKKYTSCNAGYYMTASSSSSACNTTPAAGNACRPCSTMGSNYTCSGGTACPTLNTVTITYNLNGGSGTTPNAKQCNVGSSCSLQSGATTSFYRAGYVFAGWSTTSTATTGSTSMTFTAADTVYAVWTKCAAGTYKGGSGTQASAACSTCPSGYPNSAEASTAITQCYSNTKSRAWTGSQVNGSVPTNCASVKTWGSCSKPACDYVAYSNSAGTGDGTIKSGCSTNSASCTKPVVAVTAKAGYYDNGTTCAACSGLASGFYPNSAEGNEGGASACYTNSLSGKYVASANATSATACANWTYKGAHTVNYGSTSSCYNCLAVESGWTKASGTGWTTYASCKETKTGSAISSYCDAGVLTKTQSSASAWGTSAITTNLSAKSGAYVSGQTCLNCTQGSYCTGGTAAAIKCAAGSYSGAGASACTPCQSGKTTSTTGQTSCNATCSNAANVSTWSNATWAANTVTNLCTISTCSSGYTKNSNACVASNYTITYKNGGGTGSDVTQSVTYNTKFTTKASNTFTRPGYNFSSWGGSYPNPSSDYTYTTAGNTTLTAQWSACANNPTAPGTCNCGDTQFPNGSGCEACSKSCSGVTGFTLGTYDVCKSQTNNQCYRNCTTSDVANSSAVSGTVTKGGTVSCKATSCKANFYLSGSGCAACVPNATCPGEDEPFTCNTGYHLSNDGTSCEPNEYSITLKKNGGTGTINGSTGTNDAVQTCKHGELCNLPSSGLTRTGYAFTGWGTSSSCTSGVFQRTFTSATTLYACWSQQTTTCQSGKYYNGSEHVTCPAGMFCPGTGSTNIGSAGCAQDCPGSGTSDAGATSQTQCYISCSGKTITGGKLTADSSKSNYNGSTYPACTYTANCNEGYLASGNGTSAATCTKCQNGVVCPGGTSQSQPSQCPAGSYCEAGIAKTCPSGGTSDAGAGAATDCYKVCQDNSITGGTQEAINEKVKWTGSAYPSCTYNANCNPGYVASGNGTTTAKCTQCQNGVVCPGGTSQAEPELCPVGSYCIAGISHSCPAGGTSAAGAVSKNDCYKVCSPTLSITNGQGISTGNAYYNGSEYPACQYRAECNDDYIAQNSPSANPSCIWADPDACPIGFYCPPDSPAPIQCPDGGTSDIGSTNITQCYKIFDDYEGFQNGVASAKCFYQNTTTLYDACSILEVKSCIAGYWYAQQNAFLCSEISSGYYSPAGQITRTACPVDPSGGQVGSLEKADSYTDCYKTCSLNVSNSTSVAAKDNEVYGITEDTYAACSFAVTCETGYTVQNNNTANPSCKANTYTITLDKNGGTGSTQTSIQCTFDSGSCTLPAVTGLSRPGYTVQAKWCSDKNGNGPCYYAGQSTATNISETGKDVTLYAVWLPNIYKITLDHQNANISGAPSVVYLKYANGWYSDDSATTPISKLTTLPEKTGYDFAGYYNSTQAGGIQITSASGVFQTSANALTFTTKDASIYAKWSAGMTSCAAGTYYTGTGSLCQACSANHYCPGGTFATDVGTPEGLNACPEQGASPSNSTSITQCYKTKLAYTASHGSGTQTCNYDDDTKSYNANCTNKVINICDSGYYLADSGATTPDCEPVGKGYYSEGTDTTRMQCPNNGDTESATSTMIQQCFKTGLSYSATYGSGTQRCFYSSGTGTSAIYQRDCDTKVITSCRGGYWLANSNDIDCVEVGQNYYSVSNDTQRHACPANGKTNGTTSDDILLCYKDGLPYTEALHGTGEYLCYYTSGTGDSAIYSSSCNLPTITSCDAGYYYDHLTLATDCIEAEKGYYSPVMDINRYQCAFGGTTKTTTSESSAECYRDDMMCRVTNGSGEQTCNYNEIDGDYTLDCQTCYVTECDEGFSQVGNTCITCPADNVCTDGKQQTCASLTGGLYTKSDPGTTDVSMCYTSCALEENAAAMDGRDYYTAPDTCTIRRCMPAYTLNEGQCDICPAGSFCDGTIDPINPGDDITSCDSLKTGEWSMSLPGSKDATQCYAECKQRKIENGTALPVNDTEFYPTACKFTGISDTGNPCDIIDDVCVETSCNAGYEMKDGKCVQCYREHAIGYTEGGICHVSECVAGYHPNGGDKCEPNLQECSVPNAVYAERTWDFKKNAFGPCVIKECESEFHLSSNACVSDVQPCNVENGAGFKEWDPKIKDWGKCIAVSCNPGYTNDPSETNELTKQCGECKNKYSTLGKLAVSSYVQGCEIASCMYQGELYTLENNECIQICPLEEYSDETGTKVWDESRKKCVRTCNDGYTMW